MPNNPPENPPGPNEYAEYLLYLLVEDGEKVDPDLAGKLIQALQKSLAKPKSGPPPLPAAAMVQRPARQIRSDVGRTLESSPETPRIVRCYQYRHGKIVEYPGGPIIRGCEHQPTGKSKGAPDISSILVSSSETDCFFPDHCKYAPDHPAYPWKNEGGEIATKTCSINGKNFVICARHNIPSEGGQGINDRHYHEYHAIIIPEEEWSIAIIPKLNEMLKAEGVTECDVTMPTIDIDINAELGKKLPQDWFDDYTQDLIVNILSGQPIGLQDWETTEGEFLNRLYYCLLCMPAGAARKISFGAGLGAAEKANLNISQAMYVTNPILQRKIGGKWIINTPKPAGDLGERYLEVLKKNVGNCRTPKEVMQAVQRMPQKLVSEAERALIVK